MSESQPCPDCGQVIDFDPRFVPWCVSCDWNVDPTPQDPPKGRLARRRARRGEHLVQALFEEYRSQPERPAGLTRWRAWGYLAAILVHLVTVGLLALAVLIALSPIAPVLRVVFIGLLLAIAWQVRPRFGRLAKGGHWLARADAPYLFELLDQVAATAGARPPHLVGMNREFNASYGVVGLRRRRILRLGVPLWNVLDDDEKLALLGHEMAHDANGDIRQSIVVITAIRSLAEWEVIFHPAAVLHQHRSPGHMNRFSASVTVAEFLAALLLIPIFAATRGARWVLTQAELRSGQRAEYWADQASVAVAGSEHAHRLLEKLLIADSCTFAVQRAITSRQPDIWQAQREHLAAIPAGEMERLRRQARARMQRIDETHPPSHLRAALVQSRPGQPASIRLATGLFARIADELLPEMRRIERHMRG